MTKEFKINIGILSERKSRKQNDDILAISNDSNIDQPSRKQLSSYIR